MEPLDVLQSYRCPRYLEYPSVPLYKDQVIGFLTQAVAPFYGAEQTPVTAAMINNYVKLKVISAPEQKKYSREQLICLYVIFLLKQVLSIDEIRQLLRLEFPAEDTQACYDRFCRRLEGELDHLTQGESSLPTDGHPLLEAAIRSFVCKRYTVVLLEQAAEQGKEEAPAAED